MTDMLYSDTGFSNVKAGLPTSGESLTAGTADDWWPAERGVFQRATARCELNQPTLQVTVGAQ